MEISYPKHTLGDYSDVKDYELRKCLRSGECIDILEVGYDLGDGRWLINHYVHGSKYYIGSRRVRYIYLDFDGRVYGSLIKPESYEKIFSS